MNADAIREFLRREPFEPFVIRMSNGEAHEVLHPENALVMKTKVIVCYPERDRAVYCSLIHINAVEALQGMSTTRGCPVGVAVAIGFLLAAGAALGQGFRVEPYLQHPTSDAVTVRWLSETSDPGSLTIDGRTFSSSPTLATTLDYQAAEPAADRSAGLPWIHSVRVTGLAADAPQAYAVTQAGITRTGGFRTPLAAVGTAPTVGSGVRLFVYADSETEPESAAKRTDWNASLAPGSTRPGWIPTRATTVNGVPTTVDQYLATERTGYQQNLAIMQARAAEAHAAGRATLAAIAGDLVESGGEQRDWDEFWRHNAGSLAPDPATGGFAGTTAIVPALGNHENYGGPGALGGYSGSAAAAAANKFRTYFEVPDNAAAYADHTGRYHRVDFGPVTLITIDSSNTGTDGTATDTNYFLATADNPQIPDALAGSAQYQWLEGQLAAAQAAGRITFVQMHHAPYSSGVHGRPAGTHATLEDTQSGQPLRALTPLFALYDVKAVFSGHDEMLERAEVNGIHFYDVGIGGDGLRGFDFGTDGYTREFLAQADAPEVWAGDVLVSGGKHYGHLEIDVVWSAGGTWDVSITPAYAFPVLSATNAGEIVAWERRTYDDTVTFSVVPEPSSLVAAALGLAAAVAVVLAARTRGKQQEKLTHYLLRPRQIDDKSRLLAKAGFSLTNSQLLEAALRDLARTELAEKDGTNEYGTFWKIEGLLPGPRASLSVVVIWLQWAVDGSFHFVTFKPLKRRW